MSDVFISYSSKDEAIANNICRYLEEKGLSCWIAARDLPSGADRAASVSAVIPATKVFLLVCSENSAASQHIAHELKLAENSSGIRIIPYKIDDAPLTGNFDRHLKGANGVTANYAKRDYKLSELYTVITSVTGRKSSTAFNNSIESLLVTNESAAPKKPSQPQKAKTEAVQPETDDLDIPEAVQDAMQKHEAKEKKAAKEKKSPMPLIAALIGAVIVIAGVIVLVKVVPGSKGSDSSSTVGTASSGRVISDVSDDDLCSYSMLLGASRADVESTFDINDRCYKSSTSESYYIPFSFSKHPKTGTMKIDFKNEVVTAVSLRLQQGFQSEYEIKDYTDEFYKILSDRYGLQFESSAAPTTDPYALKNILTQTIKEEDYPDKTIKFYSTLNYNNLMSSSTSLNGLYLEITFSAV